MSSSIVNIHSVSEDKSQQDNLIRALEDWEKIKPFISLKIFTGQDGARRAGTTLTSGIAIITYVVSGEAVYADTTGKRGELKKGHWSWIIAGAGIGYSIAAKTPDFVGIELRIALSPALENSLPQSAYITATPSADKDPVNVLIGWHGKNRSTFAAPALVNCFVVHLEADQQWSFELPLNHQFAWAAVIKGQVKTAENTMVPNGVSTFYRPIEKVTFHAQMDSILILGSSPECGYDLIFQNNSVHTSPEALHTGLKGIAEAERRLRM